ncbi:MAG TPA: non-canonical purine NTP pyrophosphatase [Pyrinomonadaceae bacterium]|jgi:XTP/dITP diphosphohydrolase|nr:non-canonical purine NTP pyrophosphatase [Pyrinomonadaceae bacterium]
MKIYFVTASDKKFAEITAYLDFLKSQSGSTLELQQVGYDLHETLDLDINVVVRGKAIEAYRHLGVPCVVEHSGLFMEALKKLPGVMGRMIWDAIGDRICDFLRAGDSREATAISVLAYCDGKQIRMHRGETRGHIAEQERGSEGFNWDSIFIPEGSDQTYAEMGADKKRETAPSRKAWDAFIKAEFPNSRRDADDD